MTAKRATSALALAAALVLAGQSALAQHHGGGHYGGSHAVPRAGGYGGGMAQGRHPQAGTGGYGYHNYYGGHHGDYGHGYYGYGHGYSHGYGYGYYHPYSSFYFSFGWPHGYVGWGWPYGWRGYYPSYYAPYYGDAPSYGYSEAAPAREYDLDRRSSDGYYSNRSDDRDTGRLRLDVSPHDASVYVDDSYWGTGRDARYMTLRSGRHAIEVVRPGFDTVRRDVDVVRGETGDVQVELLRR